MQTMYVHRISYFVEKTPTRFKLVHATAEQRAKAFWLTKIAESK